MKSKILSWLIARVFFRRNVILLESIPDCSGSSKVIEDELKKYLPKGKFRFVWVTDKESSVCGPEKMIPFWGNLNFFDKLRKNYYQAKAALILDSNRPVFKLNPKTIRIFVRHGGTLKKNDKYMQSLGRMDYFLTTSAEIAKIDFETIKGYCVDSLYQILPFGLPINDFMFEKFSLYECGFLKKKYDKIVGWLPTFRQHKNNDSSISLENTKSFSLPLVDGLEDFDRINQYYADQNSLLIVQLHHCQQQSLPQKDFSNILFITQKQKDQYDITNAKMFNAFDALITDYSAAYNEFVLLDRPIGLCVDDYEEYSAKVGFYIDFPTVIQGEKLKSVEDMSVFLNHLVQGEDSFAEQRKTSQRYIHSFVDNHSTQRVVDFICSKMKI